MRPLSVIGTAVSGYRIVAPLGVGGAGAVYVAEHPLLGKRVAVKILHPTRAGDTEGVGRFMAETRAAQSLDHPGIVRILELTSIETPAGELPCIVMELLEGRTLAEIIAEDAPLSPARALIIAEQIAEVLAAAHSVGIAHRNLKSENIVVDGGLRDLERVKLLDFGIARLGAHQGTPAYLAPEQCLGFTGDDQADVYALGVLLFEMLTGRLPYKGKSVGEMVVSHISATPRRLASVRAVPRALDAIVARALEKSPDRRFDMTAFAEALRDPSGYLEPAPVPAPVPVPEPVPPPAPPPARVRAAVRRRASPRVPLAVAAAAACLLAIVSAFAAAHRDVASDSGVAVTAPAKVRLTVLSCAPGARVFFDGAEAGPAGEAYEVPAGRPVDLSVRAPRFMPHEERLIPHADEHIEVVLVPRPPEPTKPEA